MEFQTIIDCLDFFREYEMKRNKDACDSTRIRK